MAARLRSTVPPLPFDKKLVPQQWVLSLAIEVRLSKGSPGLVLNSFILSTTSFRQIHWWDKLKTPEDFAAAHVLLQKDEPERYIGKMFELMLASVEKCLPGE